MATSCLSCTAGLLLFFSSQNILSRAAVYKDVPSLLGLRQVIYHPDWCIKEMFVNAVQPVS
jgi:hypothetical protein